jgi:hypothetical protein
MKFVQAGRGLSKSVLVVMLPCIIVSCPNLIIKSMVTQVKDAIAPSIVVSSPAEGSVCANVVEVVGRVTDAATAAGNDGTVRSLSYAVTGSSVAGQIQFASDGTFSFQFSTVTLGTNFTLTIAAGDWNNNTAQVLLPLQKQSGNGIPSLAVSPGNHQVTLAWDSVPHTASYTLSYTTNGTLPSEQSGQKITSATSPCVLSNLMNGNLHIFQLRAVPESGWPESISDYKKAIPLSEQSLSPIVTGEFRQIRVKWSAIPGTGEFEVWRSTQKNGTYYNLTGPITQTSYLDSDVSNDNWYWYKVRPTLTGSILSQPNGAQADPFCIHEPFLISRCPTAVAYGVAVSGSYAYVADLSFGLRVIDITNPASPAIVGTCPTT